MRLVSFCEMTPLTKPSSRTSSPLPEDRAQALTRIAVPDVGAILHGAWMPRLSEESDVLVKRRAEQQLSSGLQHVRQRFNQFHIIAQVFDGLQANDLLKA